MNRSGAHAHRRRAVAVSAAATLTLGLAGCSTFSPATITTPYPAADGSSVSIADSGVKLRNFLVVSAAKGGPGQVIGAVVNETARPVVVTMQTDLGPTGQPSQTTIKVRAHGITQVGPEGTPVSISDTPAAPGALMSISANYEPAGGITLTVPVFAPSGVYASYTAAPTTAAPTPSATTTKGAKATPTPTSS